MFRPLTVCSRLVPVTALVLVLAGPRPALAQASSADARPDVLAPGLSPDQGRRRAAAPPDVVGPEEARRMTLEMLLLTDGLLASFDFANPALEEHLSQEVVAMRERVLAATPAELDEYAERVGPELPGARHALRQTTAALLLAAGAAQGDDAGLARPKSIGFPALDPALPDYPQIGVGSGIIDLVLTPFDLVAAAEDWADGDSVLHYFDLPVCWVTTDPATGRATRLENGAVMTLTVGQRILDILNQLQHDGCGGVAVDVTVVSLGGSCDICCMWFDVLHGVATLVYDATMSCQDMIDGAELEAAYQNGLKTFEGVEHVHRDIEHVQGTADEILDLVSCKPVLQLRRHHACDGFDSDCNGWIDDCSEDAYGPELHVDEAVAGTWYESNADAAAAVLRATSASDDCTAVTVSLGAVSGACGAVDATVTATDSCGNATAVTARVRVDGTAPTVSIPTTLAGSCHGDVAAAEAAVLAAATLSDDCTRAGDLVVGVESTVTECSLRVRLTATDAAGNVASDAVTVRVDTRAPVVALEGLTAGPPCFETVADAEAAVLAATGVTDNCSDAPALVPAVSSGGSPCALVVTSSVTDECGHAASDDVVVRVDGEPPTVTTSVTVPELWPANHELVDVGFSYTATDNCAGDRDVRVVVTSDEPTESADGAGGDKAPDAAILRDLDGVVQAVRLRAERSSSGNGRVYRITVEATDACGHVTRSWSEVRVPGQRSQPAVDDGQLHDATAVN